VKLIFAGTPDFAACALKALLSGRHSVARVLTQPDRPSGRGMKPQASAVKALAVQSALTVMQPASLKDVAIQDELKSLQADVMVVAAYGLILPQAVLDIPRCGALNIHASLLPRWRGAAPIQRALLAGDAETGITIMRMDAGLDTGPMLLSQSLAVADDDTAGSLHDRLAALGADLIVRALDRLEAGELSSTPQPAMGATYARKIEKAEALVDWKETAVTLDRKIRAFNPAPGAGAKLAGADLKLWRAHAVAVREGQVAVQRNAGEVLAIEEGGIRVACGDGDLVLSELQKPGGKRLDAKTFLRGFPIKPGDRFLT
jgi:methionyl-tRNA formyltransferase